MKNLALPTLLTLIVCAPPLSAGDWFVDDDGGPGVDFTDIQPAIDAAQAGDVIHVAIGAYSGFTLAKALTIQGDASAPPWTKMTGPVLVDGIPEGATAWLLDLTFDDGLALRNSAGTIVGARLNVDASAGTSTMSVIDCDDARVYRSDVSGIHDSVPPTPALLVRTSRLEVVQTQIRGHRGPSLTDPGGLGILAAPGAELFASLCNVSGGDGWSPSCGTFGSKAGGDGGDALHVLGGASVTITGPREQHFSSWVEPYLIGGWGGGCKESCAELGEPGRALRVENGGVVRHSATPLYVGDAFFCSAPDATLVEPGGVVTTVDPIDPSLFALNWPQGLPLSDTARFELTAEPGAPSFWFLGSGLLSQAVPGVVQDLLIAPVTFVNFGAVPATGSLPFETGAPMLLPAGTKLYFQVLVVGSGGPVLTNSNVLFVR